MIRKLKILGAFIMFVSLTGCMKELLSGEDFGAASVAFKVATLSGSAPEQARFIVLNLDKVVKNEIIDRQGGDSDGYYPLKIVAGEYRLIIVVNETSEMETALSNAKSLNDLKAIQLATCLRENDVTLIGNNLIKISSATDTDPGDVSIDGNPATSTPKIMLKRTQAKTTLYVRKYTKKNGLADDKITIKKVSLCHLPKYSYLIADNYTGTDFTQQVLYNNASGTLLEQDVTEGQYANKGKAEEGAYINIVSEIPRNNEPNNIFPEYLMQDPTKADAAAYLLVEAGYSTQGSNTDVTYSIPLRGNESIDNYDLYRNHNYTVFLTVTQRGDFDAFEVAYNVQPWDDQEVNVDINKDPFLDITNVDVNIYDAAVTRVYFFSNQPADKVFISPVGHIGTASGMAFNVENMYHKLVNVGEGGITEKADNFHYDFDNTTGTGKGYMDIINLNTDKAGNDVRVINLTAGKLNRSINVCSIISEEAAKKNETPYVGTFHRFDERSERIITWHNTGDWKATIRNLADYGDLVIDRLASPAFGKGLYAVQNPMGPEGAEVMDGTDGSRTISGKGRIYFRVGWKDFSKNNKNRYAIIDVSYANDTKTQTIYCRQGQEPEGLVAAGSLEMATYNVALPEEFTKYPTMAGYLYQWNDRTPYSPVGTVAGYNTTVHHETFEDNRSVCPDGYGYPDEIVVATLDPILSNLNVHWGYYADGYFDRRAITNHAVNSTSINVAYAGNVFYNNENGKSIFTPTTGGRNEQGIFSLVKPGDEGKASIMSGFWASYSASSNNAVTIFQYSDKKSEVGDLNKLSALSVRCVLLEGYSVYFNANGGSGAPRSITKRTGETITMPNAPSGARSDWHLCVAWNTKSDGKGDTYKFGDAYTITQDINFYAMWESMENLRLASGSASENFIAENRLEQSYNNWNENNGNEYKVSVEAITGEPAYPYLQVSGDLGAVENLTKAYAKCQALSSGNVTWRLPRISELYWLYKYNDTYLKAPNSSYLCIISGTKYSSNEIWGIGPSDSYALNRGELYKDSKNTFWNVRCVREIRPYNITIEESK